MNRKVKQMTVPPYIGQEPLVGRYYPALCRRCGWVGSSEELTEDEAQCTRHVGDSLCLGDCDELERHDLLAIIQAMAPTDEPYAWIADYAACGGGKLVFDRVMAEQVTSPMCVKTPVYLRPAPAEQHQGEPVQAFKNCIDARSYIAELFNKRLQRHDFNQYITERLAGDFAFALANWLVGEAARVNLAASSELIDYLKSCKAAHDALAIEPSAPGVQLMASAPAEDHLAVMARSLEVIRSAPSVPDCEHCGDTGFETCTVCAGLERSQ